LSHGGKVGGDLKLGDPAQVYWGGKKRNTIRFRFAGKKGGPGGA